MTVRYTRDALQDLNEISSYLAERSPSAAAAVLDTIERTASRLDRFPYSAQETEMPGVRATPALPFRYIIFYRARQSDVEILYVRHAARRRPWEPDR